MLFPQSINKIRLSIINDGNLLRFDCLMIEFVVVTYSGELMLTGDQIAAARRLAGIRSQAELAIAAGVSRPTIERAEAARSLIPSMNSDALARIVRALEAAGLEFHLEPGSSLAGGVGMRRRQAEGSAGLLSRQGREFRE
jgi:hypothetical protein